MDRIKVPRYNRFRAFRAEVALDAYQAAIGGPGSHDAERIRDLMQDMIHWLASKGTRRYSDPAATLMDACETAILDFLHELGDPE